MTNNIGNIQKVGHQRRLGKIVNDIRQSKFFGDRAGLKADRARLDGYLQALEEEGLIDHEAVMKVMEAN